MFGIRRREFITLLGGAAAAWPLAARAQQPADKRPLIAVLIAGTEAAYHRDLESFRGGMRQLGYSDGENIHYEYRFADGDLERLPGLAADLVRRNPNVIVSSPLAAHLAAKQATSTIPIVMASVADPVAFGLAQSLSHPGGNLTGLGNFADVLASKQLDLLRELMPRLSRVAVLVNTSNPLHAPQNRGDARRSAVYASGLADCRDPFRRTARRRLCDPCGREGRRALSAAGHGVSHVPSTDCRAGCSCPPACDLWLSRPSSRPAA